jgi:hypothetical protein
LTQTCTAESTGEITYILTKGANITTNDKMIFIKKALIKHFVGLTNRKKFIAYKLNGECLAGKCPANCCKKLMGFLKCPFLCKDNLCWLEKKGHKPFICRHSPTLWDYEFLPECCPYKQQNKEWLK